jgi:hypothetical protein
VKGHSHSHDHDHDTPSVCVLGAGALGSAIARALASSHYDVHVWNRSPSKARALEQENGHISSADSVRECIDAAEVIISVLSSAHVDREVLGPVLEGASVHKIWIAASTSTPKDVRDSFAFATKVKGENKPVCVPLKIQTKGGTGIYFNCGHGNPESCWHFRIDLVCVWCDTNRRWSKHSAQRTWNNSSSFKWHRVRQRRRFCFVGVFLLILSWLFECSCSRKSRRFFFFFFFFFFQTVPFVFQACQ